MDVIGVIPARYASKRLEYKLMCRIAGKTLLQWSWENASGARSLDKLIIACDSSQLQQEALGFGAEVVMTSAAHPSGTDRIAEAVRDIDAKIVVNIQADEPLIHPSAIDRLVQEMQADANLNMATIKKKIEDEAEVNNPNVVKVICNKDDFAIYFSRFPIPYLRQAGIPKVYFKHIGLYAYSKDFLFTFKNLPRSYLEEAEKLEQLRALQAGYKVKVLETQFDSLGVDTEEDLTAVEQILTQKNKVS